MTTQKPATKTRKRKPKTIKIKYRVFCATPPETERPIQPGASPARVRALKEFGKIWANGTNIRYCFYDDASEGQTGASKDGHSSLASWVGTKRQRDMVREGFKTWKDLGIGLTFEEIDERTEAEVRIGFMVGDGHWSYLGRDVLDYGPLQRTMNLDRDILGPDGFDTVLHEIGHTLGLSHEHQNPKAGIVWDTEAVYDFFAQDPNYWSRETTDRNILNKIPRDSSNGTNWDKDSIMHYAFEAGLIKQPVPYQTKPLTPAGGLSELDKGYIRKLYPPLDPMDQLPRLERYDSRVVKLNAGDQFDAVYSPTGTDNHSISTFGKTDLVLTVFEDTPDGPRYLSGDDDGGQDENAKIELKLFKGKNYIVRTRLYFNDADGEFGLMVH